MVKFTCIRNELSVEWKVKTCRSGFNLTLTNFTTVAKLPANSIASSEATVAKQQTATRRSSIERRRVQADCDVPTGERP